MAARSGTRWRSRFALPDLTPEQRLVDDVGSGYHRSRFADS